MSRELETYANRLINQLNRIKDAHRDVLYADELNAINNICNLVAHNIKEIKEK